MVIVKLYGGLGNQLFQYAAGLAIAVRNRVKLKLDITAFEVCKLRKYSLMHFNIMEDFASASEIHDVRYPFGRKISNLMYKMPESVFPRKYRRYVCEQNTFKYDAMISKIKTPVYIDGYWQAEGYFHEITDQIRSHFIIKTLSNSINEAIASRIKQTESVSLHVRRGDYISNPDFNRVHGCCSLDYYQRAIEIIKSHLLNPTFFLFSDDLAWVKKNIKTDSETFIMDQNDPSHDYEDLRLMCLCKHHIIANSTFSWWGAWLSQFLKKIVIAPICWINDQSVDTRELIPHEWTRI